MIKFIIFTCLLFSINAFSFELEDDKKKHIQATSLISGLTYKVMRSNHNSFLKSSLYGIFTANFIGLMKEYSDHKIDNNDLSANALGSVLGIGLFYVWEF